MLFHHEINSEEIASIMEKDGYSDLSPAIEPKELLSLCEDDTILLQCHESMNRYCMRYAHDVFNMMYEQKVLEDLRKKGEDTQEAYEELKVIDLNRHNLHNAMIDSVNLVSRELGKRELDNTWVRELVSGGRSAYSRFALLTFYKLYSTMNKPS